MKLVNTIFNIHAYLNPQINDMLYKLHFIESYGSGVRRTKTGWKRMVMKHLCFYQTMKQMIIHK